MNDLRTEERVLTASYEAVESGARVIRNVRRSGPCITARPSAEEKAQFQLLARHVGLSESALALNATVRDPKRAKLIEVRQALVAGWLGMARTLEAQGERELAADVREFARTLPPVRTDRERLAAEFVRYLKEQRALQRPPPRRERDMELTR